MTSTDLTAAGVRLVFEPRAGLVATMTVRDGGRDIAVLHKAPWVDDPSALPDDISPHLARLAGDFFCAPFAQVSGDGSAMHGWPANGDWAALPPDRPDASRGRWVLRQSVAGATVIKDLSLSDGHPFLYQRHLFIGGSGVIPAANHAMVRLPGGGHLRFSAKRFFESAPRPQETDPARGRSQLAYPARAADPRAFPLAAGGTADLTRYPWGPAHEDFVVGVEAAGSPLGWTAVTRIGMGDLYLSLRHPRATPMTMLWHSNGGRDYAPWSGRHLGCLGVEEGAALPMLGLGAGETPDPLTAAGQATGLALSPDSVAEMRHVIGMIAWPSEEPVASVQSLGGLLRVTGEGGASRDLQIRGDFLRI
jgi:hypothetical protein